MDVVKVAAGVRKTKKKQVKDELDRIKQAEKKKRRLEKALATSAAIRSELEKKKLKKKEEQERLDEEGAAIAEAVALHVLLGEDSDDSSKIMLTKDEGPTFGDHASKTGIIIRRRQSLVPCEDQPMYLNENLGWFPRACIYGHMWNHRGSSNFMVSSDPHGRDFYPHCLVEENWRSVSISPDHLAAQAVSSLQIADDARVEAYAFNRMLRG